MNDTTFDLKINLGHSDIYFTVQWYVEDLVDERRALR